MSQLIFVEQKPMQGKEHVPQSGAVIGREGSDINIADPEVSRRHATIHVDGDKLSIEDLGSTNGTFVNGQQIQGTRELSEGDEVRLGNTVWRVQPSAQATATADGPAAAPPQVTAARQVPEAPPPPPDQAPPAPTPPVPAAPTAQQPAAPKPPTPQPPAPQPPAPGGAAGARGDVPAPDFQPSAIRRVVPPPGGPAAFQDLTSKRQRGSAATRLGATVLATIAVALTAAAVVAYYVIEPFESGGSSEVEDVIITFATAFADGDGDTACDQLTDDAQEDLASQAEGIEGGCEELVALAGSLLPDDQKDQFRDIEPRDIQVDGDTATATVEDPDDGDEDTVELVREGGDWKISDPGN